MKKIISALFMMSSFVVAHAQSSSEPYLVKQLSGEAIQRVKAETSGGNIAIAGVDASVRIEVYVQASNGRDRNISKEEIKKRLDEDYDLNVTAENHELVAIAKPKHHFSNWNKGLSISFKIYVPASVSSTLRTSGGNITLSSLNGMQDFTTSGGNLDIDHLTGHIKGRTSGGNINFTDLKDDIDLTTSGGNIIAKKSGGTITLSTSGGELRLNDLQGNIKATTSGGNVNADLVNGDLYARTSGGNVNLDNLSCSVDASTSGGNISVNIITLGKFVKISNSGGNVDLKIPQNKGLDLNISGDKVSVTAMSNFKGDIKKDKIEGSLNGGGIPVNVHGGSHVSLSLK